MLGLGDTYCTDDQLDALATCPAGYVPDYVSTCSCLPGPNVTTDAAGNTCATSALVAGYCPSGSSCSGSEVMIGGVCTPATGGSAIASSTASAALSSLTASIPTYAWWGVGLLAAWMLLGGKR